MDNIPKNQIKSRNSIEQREHEDAAASRRILMVDEAGNAINNANPMPTTAVLNGNVILTLDGFDQFGPSSILITGSETGAKSGIKHAARVDSDLDLRVGISSGANKAGVNASNELSVIDGPVRTKLDAIIAALAATLNVNDTASQTILNQIKALLAGTLSTSDASTHSLLAGTLTTSDALTHSGLSAVLAALASTLAVSDSGTHTSLATIISSLASTLSVSDATTHTGIAAILTALAGTLSVSDSASHTILTNILAALGSVQLAEPVKMSGTIDGTVSGTELTFVNNRKMQILAAHDRDQIFTYADFGTKNQRITRIDYVSPTIGVGAGFTARKNLIYVLDGTRYRRTNITWALV